MRRVHDLIAEIGAATQEQTSGIGQVNQAVTQLDQATQQNAALVEESAAAADSLRGQAARLVQAVSASSWSARRGWPRGERSGALPVWFGGLRQAQPERMPLRSRRAGLGLDARASTS